VYVPCATKEIFRHLPSLPFRFMCLFTWGLAACLVSLSEGFTAVLVYRGKEAESLAGKERPSLFQNHSSVSLPPLAWVKSLSVWELQVSRVSPVPRIGSALRGVTNPSPLSAFLFQGEH
jgi:hypothetical protein